MFCSRLRTRLVDDNHTQLQEIEADQEALRGSIEQSRKLCEKTDDLIRKHKQSLQDNEPSGGSTSPWD